MEAIQEIIAILKERYPEALCALQYRRDYELMISVRLSAQCTDARVNLVTPALFERFPTLEAFAAAEPEEVEPYVRSCGFYKHKARDIVLACRMLRDEYGGKVPDTMEQLLRIPGVGRKTANVIQSVVFNKAAMAVDTHVFRVSHRLGLVGPSCTTPLSVEKELTKHIPEADIPIAHHWLILHGRYVCQARTPQCDACGLKMLCKDYEKRTGIKEVNS